MVKITILGINLINIKTGFLFKKIEDTDGAKLLLVIYRFS